MSSQSAQKHALLAKDVVVTTGGHTEDQAEFDALLDGLRDSYRPRNLAEDMLVQELAICCWRSLRANRYERGELTRADAAPNKSELTDLDISLLELQSAADAYDLLLQSSRGIKLLLRKIEEAQDAVRVSRSIPAELRWWLSPEKKWDKISHLGKDGLLAALEKEAEELAAKKGQIQENESQRRRDQLDCLAIPSLSAIDRLGRYETRNVRHRYKVEARLAELQARPVRNAKLKSGGDGVAESDEDIQFCQTNPTDASGEPKLRKVRARVATPEEQVAQRESEARPDPIESPTNETVAVAEGDVQSTAEQCPSPTDTHTPVETEGEAVAQEESGAPPEVDPIESPTNETVAAAENDVVLAAEQTPRPTDAHTSDWTDGGDGAESRSDEPDETG